MRYPTSNAVGVLGETAIPGCDSRVSKTLAQSDMTWLSARTDPRAAVAVPAGPQRTDGARRNVREDEGCEPPRHGDHVGRWRPPGRRGQANSALLQSLLRQMKRASGVESTFQRVSLVAGAGFEPATFGL